MLRIVLLLIFFVADVRADGRPPQVVVLTTVKEGSLNECITGVGTFTPYNDVVLKAEIAGRIETVHFKEGESVKENQKLFSLHAREQEAKVKKAEATLKLSKSSLERKAKLLEKKFISSQELEKTEAEMRSCEAELALAKEDLAKTQITAPFEGVLSAKKVSKGAYVTAGDDLVRIQDLDPMRLTFQLPQKDIPLIKVGDSIIATTDVYPDKSFEGKVEAIDPSVNEKTRSFTVYATFPNKEKLLIPGLYAHLNPSSSLQKTASLLVPEQALVIRQDGAYVFKKVADKAVLTKITLGTRTTDQAEILTGLQKGDEIVLEGQDKIHDGDAIAGVQVQ